MEKRTKQRMCIECRKACQKGELIRIVRTPDGQVEYDQSGKANGRGAYLCSLSCLEKALAMHKLDRALRVKVSEEQIERIAQEAMSAVLD